MSHPPRSLAFIFFTLRVPPRVETRGMLKSRVTKSPAISSVNVVTMKTRTMQTTRSDGAYSYADARLLNDAAFLITHLQQAVACIPASVQPRPPSRSLSRMQLDAETLNSLLRLPCQLAQLSPAVWCAAAVPAYALLRRFTYLIATEEQWQDADIIKRAVISLRKVVLLSPHSPAVESYDKTETSFMDTRDRFVIGEASRAYRFVHISRSFRYQFPAGMQVADVVRDMDGDCGGECRCESDMMMRRRFRHLLTPLQGLNAVCFRLVHDDYLAMLTAASNAIELLGMACHTCVASIKSYLKALRQFTDGECDTPVASSIESDLSFMSPSRHWILPTTATLSEARVVTMSDDLLSSCACCMRSANNSVTTNAGSNANAAPPLSTMPTTTAEVGDDDALQPPVVIEQAFHRRSSRARVQRAVFTRALIESVLPSQKKRRQIDTAKSVLRTMNTRRSAGKKGFA